MHQETTTINAEDLFGNFSNLSEFQNMEDSFEKNWKWPDEIGNGFMSVIKFRPGLMLSIGDYQLRKHQTVSFEWKSPPFVIGFSVPANIRFTLGYGQRKKDALLLNSGKSFIFYLPEWQGIAEYPARTPVRAVGIYVDPLLLHIFLDGQHDRIPTGMHDIVNGANEKHYYHALTTTPIVNMAIHQILDCPYRGPLRRLYLESKALELITHQLAQLVFAENYLQKPSVLCCDDIERIHEAKDILISNMQNPPFLFDLARQVGLNDTKLKRGFRQVFGTTVFGCLRAHRMERGRQLLVEGKMNVTEVSYEVGYSERANFTRAFTKQFGVSPLFYLREARKGISSTN